MSDDGRATGDQPASEQPATSPDDQFEYYRPRPNLQVWLILGGIICVIAVAVLFIYQAGDKKTILTMEPLGQVAFNTPAGLNGGAQPGGCTQPGACDLQAGAHMHPGGQMQNGGGHMHPGMGMHQGMHSGGGLGDGTMQGGGPGTGRHRDGVNCPTGGGTAGGAASPGANGIPVALATALGSGAPQSRATPPLPQPGVAPANNPTAQPALCQRCGGQALPLCSQCSSIMLPMGESLFYCPHCGLVGSPPCPYCGARMTPAEVRQERPELLAAQTPGLPEDPTSGQFVCPVCRATGLPNWDATGKPICPSCGATMSVQGQAQVR